MGFIVLVAIVFLVAWTTKRITDREQLTGVGSYSAEEPSLSLPERLPRRSGEPRVHRATLQGLIPYGALALLMLGLTALIAKSLLPVALLGMGFALVLLGVGVVLNQHARREWHEEDDRDAEVRRNSEVLEEFTIPEEWSRYL